VLVADVETAVGGIVLRHAGQLQHELIELLVVTLRLRLDRAAVQRGDRRARPGEDPVARLAEAALLDRGGAVRFGSGDGRRSTLGGVA
jgi:hypothetical protein